MQSCADSIRLRHSPPFSTFIHYPALLPTFNLHTDSDAVAAFLAPPAPPLPLSPGSPGAAAVESACAAIANLCQGDDDSDGTEPNLLFLLRFI